MATFRVLEYAACGILLLFVGGIAFADSNPAPFQGAGDAAVADASAVRAKALFEKKCSQCHPLEKVLKTREGSDWWRVTVTRMGEKPGADISADDSAHIMRYILEEMPPPGQ